jgi:hypothetical protein
MASSTTTFVDYPKAEEGPKTGYESPFGSNPALRGIALPIAANMYVHQVVPFLMQNHHLAISHTASTSLTRVSFLQQAMWNNAGFGKIKDLPILAEMPTRWHVWQTPFPLPPSWPHAFLLNHWDRS